MFGDKLSAAYTKLSSLVALLTITGFKFEAADVQKAEWAPPSADAFKAHLTSQKDAVVAEANSTWAAKFSLVSAQVTAYRTGLEAAGVKLGDFKAEDFSAAEGKTIADTAAAASIKLAVETAIAAKSAKQIAASGHPHALDLPKAEDAEPAVSSEQLMEQFNAITDVKERAAFYAKHQKKLLK